MPASVPPDEQRDCPRGPPRRAIAPGCPTGSATLSSTPLSAEPLPERLAPLRGASLRPGMRPSRLAGLLPFAAAALPLLLTLSAAWFSWHQARQQAAAEMLTTATATAEYARRLLDGMVLRLDRADDLLAGLDDAEIRAEERTLHEALRRIPARTQDLGAMHLFAHDREGRALVSGRLHPVPVQGQGPAGDEFNQVHRGASAPELHLGPAAIGEETGRSYFAVSRRRAPDPARSGYNGVLVASVDVEDAGAALARLAPAPGDVVALIRQDGALIARSAGPAPRSAADRLGPGSPMLAAMRRGDAQAMVDGQSTVDGVRRVAALRRVEGWPLYVAAARSREAVAAAWWRVAWVHLAVGLPASALMFGLGLAVRRRDRALAAANTALEQRVGERTAALAESEARLRRVQAIGRVGGFEIELATGRNLRSAEYMRLQGLAPVATRETHADWVRRLHPEDRARAERRFLDAIADDAPDTGYAQEYRIIAPDGAVRWIAARAEIERDDAGHAVRMVGAHVDVTELREAQEALAEREARLSAALRGARLGVAEYDLAERTARWDARASEIFGGLAPEACGPGMAAWLARIHPVDAAARREAIRTAVAPGGPETYDVEFRFRRPDGGWNWVGVHGAVVERDPATGRALRLAGVVQDVTERRLGEERLRLLAREVDHRARNALAVVQAAVRLTPKTDAAAFARAIEGRVATLARTHTLLADGRWEGASLRALAEGELGPFLGPEGAARAVIAGPPVLLPPAVAQAVAMALHELRTNAQRHGALRVAGGLVRLDWEELPDGAAIRILWREAGAAAPEAPLARGFGARVLEATVQGQLGGEVRRLATEDGLGVELLVPLRAGDRSGRTEGGQERSVITSMRGA